MAGTDTATTEATAPVEATPPAEETHEDEFEKSFEEFAAVDDTATTIPPIEGRKDEGQSSAGVSSAEPTKTTDDQATPDEPSSDAAAGDTPEPTDIWANATSEQKAAHEASQHEVKSNRTRVSALNRQIARLTAVPEPAVTPDADTPATPETDESWEQFKTEYPEVANPMEKRFEDRMTKLEAENADLRGRVTGITDGQLREAINTEEALLVQRHPDWEQLTTSDDFTTWLPNQPRYVQEGFVRNGTAIVDGQEAASLIDLFKEGQAPVKNDPGPKDTAISGKATRRQRRLESAVTTESSQAGPGAGPPEGDFDAAFDHFAALP